MGLLTYLTECHVHAALHLIFKTFFHVLNAGTGKNKVRFSHRAANGRAAITGRALIHVRNSEG